MLKTGLTLITYLNLISLNCFTVHHNIFELLPLDVADSKCVLVLFLAFNWLINSNLFLNIYKRLKVLLLFLCQVNLKQCMIQFCVFLQWLRRLVSLLPWLWPLICPRVVLWNSITLLGFQSAYRVGEFWNKSGVLGLRWSLQFRHTWTPQPGKCSRLALGAFL